jgi:hypothetical protein
MSERVQPITSVEQPAAEATVDLIPIDAQPLAGTSQADALRQAVADAQTTPLLDRQVAAGRINTLLLGLQPHEANGRLLVDLLHAGVLTDLVDEQERDARREAVRALLRLGFPWALEIDPDTLTWFRKAESRQRNRRLTVLAVVASTLLGLGAYFWSANQPTPPPPTPPIVLPAPPVPPSPPTPK